jgi:hypothetical protein
MSENTDVLAQLKAKIAEAAASGDDVEFNNAIKEYNKHKAEVAKAIQAQIAKENEALAKDREAFEIENSKAILDFIKTLGFDCYKLKAKTIIVTVSHKENESGQIDKAGTVAVTGGVKLAIPTAKTTRTSTGGGTGKTKAELGISMSEIVEKFGTDDEKAEASALKAQGRENRADSKLYALQQKIKKRALADGLIKPIS